MKILQVKSNDESVDLSSIINNAPNHDNSASIAQSANADVFDVKTPTQMNNTKLDRLGVWITSLCALHCLLLPILIPLAPLIASSFVASQWFERTILTFSILVGFAALFIGFHQYHRQLYPIYSLTLGGLIYWNKHMFGEPYEPFVVAIGAVFIIGAHLANLRLCKKCKKCETC